MLVLLAWMMSGVARAETVDAYVQADVLNLRAEPSTDAEVVAKLRINTRLVVEHSRGAWTEVTLEDGRYGHPVTGWVSEEMLAPMQLSAVNAMDVADNSTDADERAKWVGRARAIQGQVDGDDVFFAVCRHRAYGGEEHPYRAEYLGRWNPTEGFVDGGQGDWQAAQAAREDMTGWIGALPWHAIERTDQHPGHSGYAGESELLPGTPFAKPFLTVGWNEDAPSAFVPSESGMGDGELRDLLVLGPCDAPNQLLAAAPMKHWASAPVGMADAAASFGALAAERSGSVYGFEVSRPLEDDTTLHQVRLTVPWEWHSCGGEVEYTPARGFALVSGGEVVVMMGAGMGLDAGSDAGSLGEAAWFTVGTGENSRVLGLMDAQWALGEGVALVVVDATSHEVHRRTVQLTSGGC